jgi:hypothetical protein
MRILTRADKFAKSKQDRITIDDQGVIINGRTVYLPPRQKEIITRLMPGTWIHKLDINDEALCLVTKLRQTIAPYLHNPPTAVIESNGHGGLRLNPHLLSK